MKNKVAPPFREAEVDIEFGLGISKAGEILDMGSELGVVNRAGAWYSVSSDGTRLGQGRDNSKQFLMDNPELMDELDKLIKDMLNPPQDVDVEPMSEGGFEEEFPVEQESSDE